MFTKRVASDGDEKRSSSQQLFNAYSLNDGSSDFEQFTEFLNRGRPRFDGTHPPTLQCICVLRDTKCGMMYT